MHCWKGASSPCLALVLEQRCRVLFALVTSWWFEKCLEKAEKSVLLVSCQEKKMDLDLILARVAVGQCHLKIWSSGWKLEVECVLLGKVFTRISTCDAFHACLRWKLGLGGQTLGCIVHSREHAGSYSHRVLSVSHSSGLTEEHHREHKVRQN